MLPDKYPKDIKDIKHVFMHMFSTDIEPVLNSPPNKPGIRASYALRCQVEDGRSYFFEFFCENTFNEKPSEPEIGYTENDVDHYTGVRITKVYPGENGKNPFMVGDVVSLDEFCNDFDITGELNIRMSRCMDELVEAADINDVILERINSLWEGREPGVDRVGIRYLH